MSSIDDDLACPKVKRRNVIPCYFAHDEKLSTMQGERSISYPRSEFPAVEVGVEYSLRFTKHDGTQHEELWRCVAIGAIAEAPGEWVTLIPSAK